jgi:hypothetical protein
MLTMSTSKKKPGRRPDPDSKRSKGEPRHRNPRKAFHASPELFDAMAAYIAATKPLPTDTQVLITALEEFLEKRGFWPPNPKE